MTTQKAQSKIKTSTIAITILSVLLAVAVASTIVLAAFSVNKKADTTITFGNGVSIQVSSDSFNGTNWIVNTVSTAGATGAAITQSETQTNGIELAKFTIKNTSTDAIAVAFKVTFEQVASKTLTPLYIDSTASTAVDGTNYTAATFDTSKVSGWVYVSSILAGETQDLTKALRTVYKSADLNTLGGTAFKATIQISAVVAGETAVADLTEAVANTFVTFGSGDIIA